MIVAGFGFRAAAGADSLRDALRRAAGDRRVGGIATIADKADTPVFAGLAQALDVPVFRIAQADLPTVDTLTQSPISAAHRGTGSVAEAAALCAAGPNATLVQARVLSHDGMATCALAKAPSHTPESETP